MSRDEFFKLLLRQTLFRNKSRFHDMQWFVVLFFSFSGLIISFIMKFAEAGASIKGLAKGL